MLWEMSTQEWIMSFSFVCGFAFVTGWLSDRILLSAGFGTIGNWILVLVGAYAGMIGVNMWGYDLEWYPLITTAAIIGAALGVLLTLCTVKRVFHF